MQNDKPFSIDLYPNEASTLVLAIDELLRAIERKSRIDEYERETYPDMIRLLTRLQGNLRSHLLVSFVKDGYDTRAQL